MMKSSLPSFSTILSSFYALLTFSRFHLQWANEAPPFFTLAHISSHLVQRSRTTIERPPLSVLPSKNSGLYR